MQNDLFEPSNDQPLTGYCIPPIMVGSAFYKTEEWLRLRYQALLDSGGKCECCGQRPTVGNPLHVDHIKPRSRWPWLALDPSNLQVLCADCNYGKSNVDCTDWRPVNASL